MDALSGGDFRSAPQQRYKDPLATKYLEHNETRGLVKFSRNAWRTKNKPGSIELEQPIQQNRAPTARDLYV